MEEHELNTHIRKEYDQWFVIINLGSDDDFNAYFNVVERHEYADTMLSMKKVFLTKQEALEFAINHFTCMLPNAVDIRGRLPHFTEILPNITNVCGCTLVNTDEDSVGCDKCLAYVDIYCGIQAIVNTLNMWTDGVIAGERGDMPDDYCYCAEVPCICGDIGAKRQEYARTNPELCSCGGLHCVELYDCPIADLISGFRFPMSPWYCSQGTILSEEQYNFSHGTNPKMRVEIKCIKGQV